MAGFADPIIGGSGNLIRPSVQSPNFNLAAKQGWAILRDGSAFFFNVTASGVVTANSVVIDGAGQGLFIYDGPPALGSLVIAAVSGAGTDPFGNQYSGPGIVVSAPGPTGKNEIQIRPDKRAMFIYADS
jgi:hypothetical protein